MGERGLTPSGEDAPEPGWFDTLVGKAGAAGLAALRAGDPETALRRGEALGRAYLRAGGPRVGDARVNLRIAFPEWTEDAREALGRASS